MTPSLEGWPTKAKEAPSPHEVRLAPLDTNPVFSKSRGKIIKKLSNVLPGKPLITIYKSFVRAHLDYGDLIYDQPNNDSFCQQIESVQYDASLAITGAIKGTSGLKLYNEIGLESLKLRQWFRKLCTFYKIKGTGLPSCLFDLILKSSHKYNTCSLEDVATLYSKTDIFECSIFPSAII